MYNIRNIIIQTFFNQTKLIMLMKFFDMRIFYHVLMLLLKMSNLIELFTFQVDLHSVDEAWSDIEEMHICDEPEGKKTF